MPTENKSVLRRVVGFLTPVALGAGALVMMQQARTEPPRRPPQEQGKAVRVVPVALLEASPRATGYGVVRSSTEWKLVAEVSGRVIELHDELEDGRVIKEGDTLIKIDPRGLELGATQQKAVVASARAQLSELSTREKNTKASLKIAQRALELANKNFERSQDLQRQGTLSASEVDDAEGNVLNQQQAVQSYKSTLAQIPADRRALRAQIDQYTAGVKTAQLDVAKTEIAAPFDLRIRTTNVELGELVTAGTVLAEGDGIARAEIPAQFSIGSLQPLIPPPPKDAPVPTPSLSPRALGRLSVATSMTANVTLESGAVLAQWAARVDRFANVDSNTRTVSVVVAVDNPYERATPGVRPPLVSGMYVEVELRGPKRPDCRAVPRAALHGKKIYVATDDDRLETRDVAVQFVQDSYACIADGVAVGDRVVLTDLVPAIEGMLLEPRADERASAELALAVQGEAEQP